MRRGDGATRRGRRLRAGTGRRLAAAAAALVVGAAALGGCASVRNELGTPDSLCYIALPKAVSAVHHHGHLFGVRLVTVASLEHRAPRLYRAARQAPGKKVGQVCLVAFSGTFLAGHVEHPVGRSSGRLAVVELGYPSKHLFATLLVRRFPLPFGHPHI
jgi:hypothetical protein